MATAKREYDYDLQMFVEPGEVSEDSLMFLRWAVANKRLGGDGDTYHSSLPTSVPICTSKCGICERCR